MALPDLQGRVAVVTGASRGLGAGLAEDFHQRGMRLGLCARSRPVLTGEAGVLTREVDVADAGAVAAFARDVARELGVIDLWINNAGVLEPIAPLRDVAPEDFARHIAINLGGVVHGSQAYVRHRREVGGGGVLLNISSGAAWQGYPGWSAYCAGKAGVDRLTECVALEEADTGLRAHAVAPGIVDTRMQEIIRACDPERFPLVERFRDIQRRQAFNSIPFVARHLLAIAFDPEARPAEVVVRLPAEVEE